VGGFVEMFRIDSDAVRAEGSQEEFVRPVWFGPPDDELGVCVPFAVVLGRSDNAIVALRNVTAYSSGITLDLVAAGRELREAEAQRLFHEQHVADPDEGPSLKGSCVWGLSSRTADGYPTSRVATTSPGNLSRSPKVPC
jgi:hypothetical protein